MTQVRLRLMRLTEKTSFKFAWHRRRWALALLCGAASVCLAQAPAVPVPQTTRVPIANYIHDGWDTLSRSMNECASVVDSKVTTKPVLYLPANLPTPPAVLAMQRECGVTVEHLPRPIKRMGDVKVAEIPKEGLLYLPHRYVVPGGRFNEMYGWDSYFIILGLLADGRVPLAQGMVENFFFEIENYGSILNANRTYFLTRSQPPLLSSMIAAIYDRTHDKVWLRRAYGYARRDYALWTQAPHLAGVTGLARYFDIGAGPVPEMADDSTYYPDVIRWLLAHPEVHTDYLVEAPEKPGPQQVEQLKQSSCDVLVSKVCMAAYADGHRISAAFYRGDRAMRESGFDTTFRFGPFSGSTEDFAPVCLNSLLFRYAADMERFASLLALPAEAARWHALAEQRRAAVNRYLWHPEVGLYLDYDFAMKKSSTYHYVTTFYPLWAGLATPQQAAAVLQHIPLFEHADGLAMSDVVSGVQWDAPYGWALANWFAVEGLDRYGFHDDARRVAQEFTALVERNYEQDGTIREKYDVVSGSSQAQVATGYKVNVIGFGWTNGVYVSFKHLLATLSTTAHQLN
jgi:alpha,alpha-trehalase